jgi:hypothetical protein
MATSTPSFRLGSFRGFGNYRSKQIQSDFTPRAGANFARAS